MPSIFRCFIPFLASSQHFGPWNKHSLLIPSSKRERERALVFVCVLEVVAMSLSACVLVLEDKSTVSSKKKPTAFKSLLLEMMCRTAHFTALLSETMHPKCKFLHWSHDLFLITATVNYGKKTIFQKYHKSYVLLCDSSAESGQKIR